MSIPVETQHAPKIVKDLKHASIQVSAAVLEAAQRGGDEALKILRTTEVGLTAGV